MTDDLLRYSCQMILPGFGEEKQLQLKNASVLIVGLGGLGCPAAQYLTAAGIGTIGLADFDLISVSNLHRQILYNECEIGLKKALVAAEKLKKQNPHINIKAIDLYITSENVLDLIKEYDIILDATDNFETRYLLNDACVLSGKPLVYGAIYQYEGQLAIWNLPNDDGTHSPNYRDIFPEVDPSQVPDCAQGGVMPAVAGVIGCLQANEAISYITGQTDNSSAGLFIFNIQTLQSRKIKIGRSSKRSITELKPTEITQTISAQDLKTVIWENNYELIDVRTIEERNENTIGGRHIPVELVETEISAVNTDKPIVFYCNSGKRSALAAKIAKRKIPSLVVYSLEGGLTKW